MNFPVFDLHCDTALALLGKDGREVGSLLHNELHIDLTRARELPGYAQCFACFTTPMMQEWMKISPVEVFQRELEAIKEQVSAHSDLICFAKSAAQVRENHERGLMSAVLTVEGPAGIDFDAGRLQELREMGFLITSLGWNEKNVLTGSHKTGGGLTDQGREFVREAQRLGMAVDVSHISDEGFWDIMEITEKPIIATHSNSRTVCDHSRNLTDDMFCAICQSGGVAGFNQCDAFVGEEPTLDTVCDHILHFLELDPDGKHIALGADLDGCDVLPQGFDGVQSYPDMAQRLRQRGVDDKLLMQIFWENSLEVLDKCCT